jgi:hypothetical protein
MGVASEGRDRTVDRRQHHELAQTLIFLQNPL